MVILQDLRVNVPRRLLLGFQIPINDSRAGSPVLHPKLGIPRNRNLTLTNRMSRMEDLCIAIPFLCQVLPRSWFMRAQVLKQAGLQPQHIGHSRCHHHTQVHILGTCIC